MFRVGKPNVLRFLKECGKACEDWHNRHFRNLAVERIECASKFTQKPTARTTYTPTPKDRLSVPWYLDPESGGPNPLVKKPGIAYDETQPMEDYNS